MTTKENYLKKPNFDQSKFYKMYQTMFIDDRIMEDNRGGHTAVILYGGIVNKISLSRSKHVNENDTSFINGDGQYYCVFPVKTAREELKIKKGKYNQHKALLRDAGLIHYEEQEEKKKVLHLKLHIHRGIFGCNKTDYILMTNG